LLGKKWVGLVPFGLREGIVTGLIVLVPLVAVLAALFYVFVWSRSYGSALCTVFVVVVIVMMALLIGLSLRSRGKRGEGECARR